MSKAAIFHTTSVTIAPLQALTKQIMPEVEIVNIAEDGMIRDVMKNGGPTPVITARIASYILCAEKADCKVFMTACSSIAEAVESCQILTAMPLTRIDLAMAEEAVKTGERISVVATVETTLKPTLNLIARKAAEKSRRAEITRWLIPEAYTALLGGDAATHDRLVREALRKAAASSDVIVLAQASMGRVLGLMEPLSVPVLTSLELGIRHLQSFFAPTASPRQ